MAVTTRSRPSGWPHGMAVGVDAAPGACTAGSSGCCPRPPGGPAPRCPPSSPHAVSPAGPEPACRARPRAWSRASGAARRERPLGELSGGRAVCGRGWLVADGSAPGCRPRRSPSTRHCDQRPLRARPGAPSLSPGCCGYPGHVRAFPLSKRPPRGRVERPPGARGMARPRRAVPVAPLTSVCTVWMGLRRPLCVGQSLHVPPSGVLCVTRALLFLSLQTGGEVSASPPRGPRLSPEVAGGPPSHPVRRGGTLAGGGP